MPKTWTILRVLLLFYACTFFYQAAAQKNTVSGIIIDSLNRRPLDSVQVFIFQDKKRTETRTNSRGRFYSKVWTSSDSLSVVISCKGYNDLQLSGVELLNRLNDTIVLSPRSKMLDNIIVKARVPAVLIRNDTTEYTIDSFDRRKNAMIGELLKDLPGIEVDDEGNILHMGKRVSRLLVNGEDFFGGDRNIALENIPADLVSKIQVMDTRTRAQVFNGVRGTGEDRTINIKLKTGLQAFGSGQVHAGTTGIYRGNAMINTVKDTRHLGVMANANSQLKEGLTGNQLKSDQLMTGLHYREKLGKHLNINASVHQGKTASEQESKRMSTQYFRADSSFFNNAYHLSGQSSRNKQLMTGIDYQPSDKFYLNLQLNAQLNGSSSDFNSSNQIFENGMAKNYAARHGKTFSDSRNINTNGSLNQKFRKEGRLLSVEFRLMSRNFFTDQFNEADNDFYENGSFMKNEQLHQHIVQTGNYYNSLVGFHFYEPLLKNLRLQLSQVFDYNHSISSRKTFNVDSVSKQERLDSSFSIAWWGNIMNRRSQISLEYNSAKFSVTAGLQSLQNKEQRLMEDGQILVQEQNGWSPQINANIPLNEKQGIRFSVSGAYQNPSLEQIRPVPDNSNPLFIRMGNPSLRSSFNQQYNLSYHSNRKEGKIFSVSVSYAPIRNSIVHISYYDAYRRRIGQYVNVNGISQLNGQWNMGKYLGKSTSGFSWSINGNAGLGKNVFFDNKQLLSTREYHIRQAATLSKVLDQKKKRTKISTGLTIGYRRNVSPLNTSGINTENFTVNQRIDFSYRIQSKLEWVLQYHAGHHRLNYNANRENLIIYTDHSITNRLFYDITKRIMIQSHCIYHFNGRLPQHSGYREQLLLNFNLSFTLFKNEKGNLFLAAHDILNEGADMNRFVGENFMEDIQNSRQRGYFTIGFQYNWAKGKTAKSKAVNIN